MAQPNSQIDVKGSCRLSIGVPKTVDLNASEADDIEGELNRLLRENTDGDLQEVGGWVVMNNSHPDYRLFETNREEVPAPMVIEILHTLPEAYATAGVEITTQDVLVMARETMTLSTIGQ